MTNKGWSQSRPALAEVIVRLLALQARLHRIEAAKRLEAISNTARMLIQR